MIFEDASVIDCQQAGIVPDAESWIITLFVLSIVSSVSFFLIVYDNRKDDLLNLQSTKAKEVYKNGSFFSLLLLLLVTTAYYGYRIAIVSSGVSGVGKAISVSLFIWPSVMFLVVWCFNYTPRVKWEPVDCCSGSCFCSASCCSPSFCQSLAKYSLFFLYWSALVMYFFEVACVWIAVALDATHEVAPLIEKRYPENALQYKPIHVLLLGFTLAFYSKVLSFFWQKLFHGNEDLFSEKYEKLVDDQSGPPPPAQLSNLTDDTLTPTERLAASMSTNAETPPTSSSANPPLQTHQGIKISSITIKPESPSAPSPMEQR
jgi:hypothetical protein